MNVDTWSSDKEDVPDSLEAEDGQQAEYSLNTPQMHATLHSEFLNSVSFLLYEPLNGYFGGSECRTASWYGGMSVRSSWSVRSARQLLASLDCSFKTWLDQQFYTGGIIGSWLHQFVSNCVGRVLSTIFLSCLFGQGIVF